MPSNKALQPTFLPPLRDSKNAAELARWAADKRSALNEAYEVISC